MWQKKVRASLRRACLILDLLFIEFRIELLKVWKETNYEYSKNSGMVLSSLQPLKVVVKVVV